MYKRVCIVPALLFTNIAFGQSLETNQTELDTASNTPVVAVESATGSAVKEFVSTTSVDEIAFPAETQSNMTVAATSSVETEFGAFGTSSASTSSTTIETEEGTTYDPTDKERLFDLVYAGFEEFVRITLGWE